MTDKKKGRVTYTRSAMHDPSQMSRGNLAGNGSLCMAPTRAGSAPVFNLDDLHAAD